MAFWDDFLTKAKMANQATGGIDEININESPAGMYSAGYDPRNNSAQARGLLEQALGDMIRQRTAAPNQQALAQNRAIQEQNLASFNARPTQSYHAMGQQGQGQGYHAMGEGNNQPRSNSFHGKNTATSEQDELGDLIRRLFVGNNEQGATQYPLQGGLGMAQGMGMAGNPTWQAIYNSYMAMVNAMKEQGQNA